MVLDSSRVERRRISRRLPARRPGSSLGTRRRPLRRGLSFGVPTAGRVVCLPVLSRRHFLQLSLALSPGAGALPAATPGAELRWSELPRGERWRALVLSPAGRRPGQTYPGLLLFHGRGEARDPERGLHAWRTLYGLASSYARLVRPPPLALAREERAYIEPAQLQTLEARLRARPFAGLVVICPTTPDAQRTPAPKQTLDDYARWVERTLLPAARERAPLDPSGGIGVDGCSMGGYVAAEVFARRPHLFRTFGVVQPAIGRHRVAGYSRRLRDARTAGTLRAVHLQSSTRDPYLAAARAWAGELARLGVESTLDVLPGPHDQRWLRATGTLVMLAWHELQLRQHA